MENKRLAQLIEFCKDDPTDPFLKYGIAQEYLGMAKWNLAKEWFERTCSEHPEYLATYYHYGKLLYELGEEEAGIEKLREGVRLAEEKGDRKTLNETRELLEDLED